MSFVPICAKLTILLFESYNSALYLDSTEPGIYDVEMFVYDRYGNISKNMIKGAYTII